MSSTFACKLIKPDRTLTNFSTSSLSKSAFEAIKSLLAVKLKSTPAVLFNNLKPTPTELFYN